MHTRRLRALQEPSVAQSLLEVAVAKIGRVSQGAQRITESIDLPSTLQRLARRAREEDGAWVAWAGRDRTWLYTGFLSLPQARERGRPTLKVTLYDDDGRLQESGVWLETPGGEWQRSSL